MNMNKDEQISRLKQALLNSQKQSRERYALLEDKTRKAKAELNEFKRLTRIYAGKSERAYIEMLQKSLMTLELQYAQLQENFLTTCEVLRTERKMFEYVE